MSDRHTLHAPPQIVIPAEGTVFVIKGDVYRAGKRRCAREIYHAPPEPYRAKHARAERPVNGTVQWCGTMGYCRVTPFAYESVED